MIANQSGVSRNVVGGRRRSVRLVGPHLGAAAGEARPRLRNRTRALAASSALGLGLGLGRLGLLVLGAEHLLRGGTLEQLHERLGVDGLALEQDLGDRVELLAALDQDVLRGLVRLLDDAPDLVVDLAGDLIGVIRLGRELAAEEGLRAVVAEHPRPEALRIASPSPSRSRSPSRGRWTPRW